MNKPVMFIHDSAILSSETKDSLEGLEIIRYSGDRPILPAPNYYDDAYWLRYFANEAMKGRPANQKNYLKSIKEAQEFLVEIKKVENE